METVLLKSFMTSFDLHLVNIHVHGCLL